ncbi:MAG TPA: helix-turn-helix transcriptional regulator [Planctomycetaceae bacterium]|nr:helix-turn-helix transcriptional regulator [Planctomycetaceae bacterium]
MIQLNGKSFVVVPREEYDELQLKAKVVDLPPLPPRNASGNFPAIEYVRISLARKIIIARTKMGLTQAELAKRAGVRLETLRRLESGQTSPSVRAVDKIDEVLNTSKRTPARRKRVASPAP